MEKYFFKNNTASIINHLFQVILVTYLVLLLIEQIWSGSVSLYMNLNYLLIFVILVGILDVFSEHQTPEKKKADWKDYLFILILGVLGFAIIKFKTDSLGFLSWIISVIAGILIILISILVLEEDEEEFKINKREFKRNKDLFLLGAIVIFLLLNVISLSLAFFTSLNYMDSFRVVFGSVYVLFIPGFIISYIFFPKTSDSNEEEDKGIDWLERIALSFALSIAIVPLAVFYLNLIGIKINFINTFFTILGIILISSVILLFKKNKFNRNSSRY